MLNNLIQELVNLGIAKTVDGFSESKKELMKFEAKYGISSCEFYDGYNNSNCNESISDDDINDWIFSCNCFISCGGDLKKFEINQLMQSLLESQKHMIILIDNQDKLGIKQCKESEECKFPRFCFSFI